MDERPVNTRIYVDNLSAATTEIELMNLFSVYGNVMQVNIAVDRASHQPRGFGFVTMVTPEGARAAIKALNGRTVDRGTLIVSEAWPDEEPVSAPNGRGHPRRRASYLF
jgi:RNA recognition motif-containing protein